MSAEARAHAQRHSPVKSWAAQYLVHLTIADVVNDLHDNEFWMTTTALANACNVGRATVGRALHALVAAGVLEVLEGGGGRGRPTRFRYHPEWRRTDATPPPAEEKLPQPEPVSEPSPTPKLPHHETTTASPRGSIGADTSIGNRKEPKLAPSRAAAEEIVRSWWEAQTPRPVANFIGVVKLVERFLEAGHTGPAVARALTEAPTPTANALTFALNRSPVSRNAVRPLGALQELHAEYAAEEAVR